MTSLTDRAMLVSLNISKWSARKHDRSASRKTARDHQADEDVGRYYKQLIPVKALEEVGSIASQARTHHYAHTLPWADNGQQILTSAGYFEYTAKHQRFKESFGEAVVRFCRSYRDAIEEARLALGQLYRAADYPLDYEIAEKFDYEVAVTPLPTAADFRVQLGDAEQARIRKEIEEKLIRAEHAAMRDVWARVYKAVSHMAERLQSFDSARKTGREIQPCLVQNLSDLAALLPQLNLSQDPDLEVMRKRLVEQLCRYDAEALREDAALRQAVARSADDILADMAGYGAPKAAE